MHLTKSPAFSTRAARQPRGCPASHPIQEQAGQCLGPGPGLRGGKLWSRLLASLKSGAGMMYEDDGYWLQADHSVDCSDSHQLEAALAVAAATVPAQTRRGGTMGSRSPSAPTRRLRVLCVYPMSRLLAERRGMAPRRL